MKKLETKMMKSHVKQITDGTAIVFEIYTDAEDYESSDWQLLVILLKAMTKLRQVIFVGPDVNGALINTIIELLAGQTITFLGFVNCTEMKEIANIKESLPNVQYLFIGNSIASVVASVPYHFDDDKLNGLVYLGIIIGTQNLTFSNYEHLLMNNSLKEGFDYLTCELEQFDKVHYFLTHADHSLSVVHFQYTGNGEEIEYDRTFDAVRTKKYLLTLKTTNIEKVNKLIEEEGTNPTISFKNAATIYYAGLKDMADCEEFKKASKTLNPFKIEVMGVGENAAVPINAIWNARDDFGTSNQLLSMELSSGANKNTADYLRWSKGFRLNKAWIVENRSGLEYTLPTDGNEVTFKTGNITNKQSQDRIITALTSNNPKYLYIAQNNGTLIEEIENKIRVDQQMIDAIPVPDQGGLTSLERASIMIWSNLLHLCFECRIEKVNVRFWFDSMKSMKYLIILVDDEPNSQYLQNMGGQIAVCVITETATKDNNKIIIKCERPGNDDRNASSSGDNGVFRLFKNVGNPMMRKRTSANATGDGIELEEMANK